MSSGASNKYRGAILGAAFLMATSAIGPGFLTQTATFTETLGPLFLMVIVMSVLFDIAAQLNIWRVLTVTELRAQDISNKLLPGLGYVLAILIVLGGFAFNIGNIAGCALGLNVITGIDMKYAATGSCAVSLLIFWIKDAGKALDWFVKILGVLMIAVTVYVAWQAHPPMPGAFAHFAWPHQQDMKAIITLVGGTVGGYISFAGAHRLIDAGVTGRNNLGKVNRSAVTGIVITGVMRVVLYLAALGVVTQLVKLDTQNPAASVFQYAAGESGYKFFGVVMWSAAITSVVGASFTSVSFLKTFHPVFERNQRLMISVFIVVSTMIFLFIGKPKELLIMAGFINGFILPIGLAIILLAGTRSRIIGSFRNPIWMQLAGWLVVMVLGWMAIQAL